MEAALPLNEADRLNALSEYHILDSAADQGFDDLTKLAAQICGAPIALVSIVDRDRQWFKARFGMQLQETPRDQSFCAHALHEPFNLMVVPDAARDLRFSDNPLVTAEEGIRFYAGAPLLTPKGAALGSLCVLDRKPRELTDLQLSALRILGRQVSYLLELHRVAHALAAALKTGVPRRP